MDIYKPRPRELATEYLKAYILEHDLKAHDKLPPEREMSEMWNLNRVTLRSAIAAMEASGRLYSIQGRGTMVAPRFIRTLQNLESFSTYAALQGAESETRLLSFSLVDADNHLAHRFQCEIGDKIYRISRLRLINKVPLMIENAFIPQDIAPGLWEHDLVKGSLFHVLEKSYGLVMDHGDEKASVTYVNEDEAEYLEVEPDSPAFWIVSNTRSPEDRVIEYCRTIARVDSVEMTSVLRWDHREEVAHD